MKGQSAHFTPKMRYKMDLFLSLTLPSSGRSLGVRVVLPVWSPKAYYAIKRKVQSLAMVMLEVTDR